MKKPHISLLSVSLATLCVSTLSGEEFSTRIVDGLKRPLPGVLVEVVWNERLEEIKTSRELGRLKLRSDENGMVRGNFDEKSLPADVITGVQLAKAGYRDTVHWLELLDPMIHRFEGSPVRRFQPEYVLRRVFQVTDIARIALLPDNARTRDLKELLAGDLEKRILMRAMFKLDRAFRPGLRELVQDPDVGLEASCVLAFVGVPEDLQWIAQHSPPAREKELVNWWACDVVSSMLEPTTESQWSFLKTCASGKYDMAAAGAILALTLIASPRSRQIIADLRPEDDDEASSTKEAIALIDSKPAPWSDSNLVELGKRVAAAVKIGKWLGNEKPYYNESRDKALIDLDFSEELDRQSKQTISLTATFHEVGGLWKLRGVRLSSIAIVTPPYVLENTDEKK